MKKYLVQSVVSESEYGDDCTDGFHILGEVSFEDKSILEKLNQYPSYLEKHPKSRYTGDLFLNEDYYDKKHLRIDSFVKKHKNLFSKDVFDFVVDWWNKIKLLNKSYTFSCIIEGYLEESLVPQFTETISRKRVTKEVIDFIRKFKAVTNRYWNIRKAILIKNYPAFQYPEVECFINTSVKINSETKFEYVDLDLKLLY